MSSIPENSSFHPTPAQDDTAGEGSDSGIRDDLWRSLSDLHGPMKQVEERCSDAVVLIMSRSDARRKIMLDAFLNHGEF